ncbi:MAG: DNA translocase FtsK, partial [Candidatus Shapirobacteria bacterium]|nr:DNA translocase FtsK [Candidatus Shapirobacteria bacterium]
MPRGRRRKHFKIKLKQTTLYTFSTVGLFIIAGIIILSFSRQGPFLTKLFSILTNYFGWGTIFLPFLLIVAGLMLARLQWRFAHPNVLIGGILLMVSLVALTHSGNIGFEIWQNLVFLITHVGASLVLLGFVFIGLVITFNTSLEEMLIFISKFFSSLRKISGRSQFSQKKNSFEIRHDKEEKVSEKANLHLSNESSKQNITNDSEFAKNPMVSLSAQGQVWEYPPLSLLADSTSGKADRGDIKGNADKIEKTLESFGISTSVKEVNPGPAVTQYALDIALGTRLSKVMALSTDLALALAAPTGQIRIEAPIPGRSLVGVEVPNRSLEFVTLKRMLTSEQMKKNKSKLAVALGLNVSGEPIIADIGRMPHALIAGSTGSGKSVCIHTFIDTILFRASPLEVKFILIDPKRVELTQYNGIPHLICPVIVEAKQVLAALNWAIHEMDERYKKFAELGVRNIEGYNELAGYIAMHYLIIVIDELADIMLFAPAAIEDAICRIAQMARATGIHLIVSTQRPSVDVITGLIKANIPCRIAFNVSSQIDSRVIIDSPGAEKLLGRGDMLFIPPDQAKPSRIQGTFVSDPEIKKLIDFLKKSGVAPQYTEEVTSTAVKNQMGRIDENDEQDELFDDAVRVVCSIERASASLLQRKLKVGYARAARILDQMEKIGIIGPADGAKAREFYNEVAQKYLASKMGQE